MAQVRIQISRSTVARATSARRIVGAALIGCLAALLAALPGCFTANDSGPGLEPPVMGGGRGGPTAGDFGTVTSPPEVAAGGASGGVGGGVAGMGAGVPGIGGSAGATTPSATDAGDASVDAGPDAGAAQDAGPLSCADIESEFAAELARAQDCSGGEACASTFVGGGCSGGIAPLCGVAHREGADVSTLEALDQAYRDGGCYTGPAVCAACVQPTVACVAGRCTQQ